MLNPVPAVSRYCSSSKKPYSLVTSVNFTRYASVNTAIHRGIRRTQRGSLRGSRKEYPRHQRGDSRPRRSSPPGFNLQNGLSSVTSLHRFRDPDQPRRPNHVLGLDGDDVSPSAGFRAPGRFVKHNPSRNDRIEPSWTLSRARSFGRFSGTGRPSSFPTPLEERRGRHRRRQASQKGYTPIEQETAPSSFSPTNMIRRQRGILHHAPHGDAPVTRERESSGWSPRHHEPPWFLKHQSEQPVPYAAEDPSVRDSFGSSAPLRSRRWEDDDRLDDRSRRESRIPLSIPYTTPASEFLYGTAAVTAALRSQRRKLYKLYVYEGENREARSRDDTVRTLARNAGVEVVGVQGDWIRLMDKMATGRPHNGYILEASPLPKLPVKGLARTSVSSKAFEVRIGHQSKEEQAVNGTDRSIPYSGHVFPFVLMLDGVLDPGNLGAIVRSAFFLGVDAIAISERNRRVNVDIVH